ncbi:MAG: hypothetical protein M1837_004060 [Sclerophora amabilis]|nr:MAG: hypothetical protein M1837_004060 [Sclerophora amabilis]
MTSDRPSSRKGSAAVNETAFDLLGDLSLNDNSGTASLRRDLHLGSPKSLADREQAENQPVTNNLSTSAAQTGSHRPSRSQETSSNARPLGPPPPYRAQPTARRNDVFADPVDVTRGHGPRRPRRNSDSSLAGSRSSKLIDPEDDRRRREARLRKHRDAGKHRDGRPRDGQPQGSSKSKKPNQRLDIIDKLDVTSIYGSGLFHHDGPFDACNPHRNRKGSTQAPMQAFPKDSANNVLGGSGPLNKDIDHNQYYGNRGAEAFADFSTSGRENAAYEPYPEYAARPPVVRSISVNPVAREPVHGDESLGLGTSTFLEGAPASKTAIQRRVSEDDNAGPKAGGGLQRKVSLAQKIRGINQNRQFIPPSGRVASPDARFEASRVGAASPTQKEVSVNPSSGGGPKKMGDTNPFFNDYDQAYDKKGESIAFAAQEPTGRTRALSNPRRGLERRVTHDVSSSGSNDNKASGFLSRVKSLKGGRRQRPSERGLQAGF